MTWMRNENTNSNADADANMPVAWSGGSSSNDGMNQPVHYHFRREAKDAWIQTPPRQDAKLLRAQTGKRMIQPSKPRLQQPTNSLIGAKIP